MSVLDKDEIIRSQGKQIGFLTKQLLAAQQEVKVLKAALTRQTIEAGKSFQELRGQFDQLAQDLYDISVYWVAKLQRGLTYDEIIRYYRAKHPNTQYTSETICRRIRELAEAGFLHSPIRSLCCALFIQPLVTLDCLHAGILRPHVSSPKESL